MPMFTQAEIDAARRREAERDASLRRTTAGEIRDWLAGRDDVAAAAVDPAAPDTVAVTLNDGRLLAATVHTDEQSLPAPRTGQDPEHQALAEELVSWLRRQDGIGQAWTAPEFGAVGVELADGTEFTITLDARGAGRS